LKGFYEKKSLLQKQEPVGPPPPAGFKSYENNAAGGGVVAMITQIINDSKAMMAETVHDEEDAQAAYESFVQETNNTIEEKNKDIVNKSQEKGRAEGDKANAESDLDNTNVQLEQLSNENADLHKSCDFVLKNVAIRQEARDQEVEAAFSFANCSNSIIVSDNSVSVCALSPSAVPFDSFLLTILSSAAVIEAFVS
jgi:hypothetical protein